MRMSGERRLSPKAQRPPSTVGDTKGERHSQVSLLLVRL